jgi:hypothetical protein
MKIALLIWGLPLGRRRRSYLLPHTGKTPPGCRKIQRTASGRLAQKEPQRLLRLLRDIHASNQESAQAIRANTDAHNKKQEPSPSVVAPLKPPEAIAAYYDAEQNERKRNNFWKSSERLAKAIVSGQASPIGWRSQNFMKNVGRTAAFNIAVRAPRGATMQI